MKYYTTYQTNAAKAAGFTLTDAPEKGEVPPATDRTE